MLLLDLDELQMAKLHVLNINLHSLELLDPPAQVCYSDQIITPSPAGSGCRNKHDVTDYIGSQIISIL